MGGRRTTPPLFELLHDADAQVERSQRAGAVPAPRPAPAPPPDANPSRAPSHAMISGEEREPWLLDATKRVSLPLNYILIGAAALILLIVICVSIAWQVAFEGGKAESRQFLERLAPESTVVDPLVEDLPVNHALLDETPPTTQPPKPRPTASGTFIVSSGLVNADPRTSGDNYLWIASHTAKIDQGEAKRVVEFLDRSGLEALAAPVDPKRAGSNNARYYNVFILQGIPGDQFSQRAQEQQDLVRRVADLGKIWLREHAGTTDFRDPLWTKFNP